MAENNGLRGVLVGAIITGAVAYCFNLLEKGNEREEAEVSAWRAQARLASDSVTADLRDLIVFADSLFEQTRALERLPDPSPPATVAARVRAREALERALAQAEYDRYSARYDSVYTRWAERARVRRYKVCTIFGPRIVVTFDTVTSSGRDLATEVKLAGSARVVPSSAIASPVARLDTAARKLIGSTAKTLDTASLAPKASDYECPP